MYRSKIALGIPPISNNDRAHISTCFARGRKTELRLILFVLYLNFVSLRIDTGHMHLIVICRLNSTAD